MSNIYSGQNKNFLHLVRKYGLNKKNTQVASAVYISKSPAPPAPVNIDFVSRYPSRPVIKRNLSPINFKIPVIKRLETIESCRRKYKRLMKDSLSQSN